MESNLIKTRILVLSDTHSFDASSIKLPTTRVDVGIHCGDLTSGSTLEEFRSAIRLLKSINSSLKLVIPGNHDFTMDADAFKAKVADSEPSLDPNLVTKTYGEVGDATKLFEDASNAGIVLLDEGTHHFMLENGAALTVYASAFTPSLGAWGFQYRPEGGHGFQILEGVDIVITHGPPRGIMDYTHGGERAGCPNLFAAVARSRPRLHCFGHIHEGWGGKLVTWKDDCGEHPTHFTSIDNDKSMVISNLSKLKYSTFDTLDEAAAQAKKRQQWETDRCLTTSHCHEDDLPIVHGESTLFINAAVCDDNGEPNQKAWLVTLGLKSVNKAVE